MTTTDNRGTTGVSLSAAPVPAEPQTAGKVLSDLLDGRITRATHGVPAAPTGFDLLDRVLDGGIRVHDFVLIGGMPGVGKTVAALQMARNVALSGRTVLYVCYEHDQPSLLGRLLVQELGALATADNAPELDLLRGVVLEATAGLRSLREALAVEPLLRVAYERVGEYADRLSLVRGSGTSTGLAELRALVAEGAQPGSVLVVDYLQKVSVRPEPASEADKVTIVAEGLKDLALSHQVAVVAVVAADKEGIKAPRLRLHHLRGSSALAYECDVALLLNQKDHVVAKIHLTYDPLRAETFKHQVVFTIEKNRGGPAPVDLEFRKNFGHFRFELEGCYVGERLIDERIDAS